LFCSARSAGMPEFPVAASIEWTLRCDPLGIDAATL
jgi:hypothetical protein